MYAFMFRFLRYYPLKEIKMDCSHSNITDMLTDDSQVFAAQKGSWGWYAAGWCVSCSRDLCTGQHRTQTAPRSCKCTDSGKRWGRAFFFLITDRILAFFQTAQPIWSACGKMLYLKNWCLGSPSNSFQMLRSTIWGVCNFEVEIWKIVDSVEGLSSIITT